MFRKRKRRGLSKKKTKDVTVEEEEPEGPMPLIKKKRKKKKILIEDEDDVFVIKKKRDEGVRKKKKKKKKNRQREMAVDLTEEQELPEQEAQPSYSQEELKRLSGLAQPVSFSAKPTKKQDKDTVGGLDGIFGKDDSSDEGDEGFTQDQIKAAKRRRLLARGKGKHESGKTEVFLADAIESVKRKIQQRARSNEYDTELPETKRRKMSPPSGAPKGKTGRYASRGWNLVDDPRSVPSPAAIRWNLYDALKAAQGHGEESANSLVQTKLEIEQFEKEIQELEKSKNAENGQFIFFQQLQDLALAYTSCCEEKIPMIRNALKEFRELRENHRKMIRTTQVERAMEYFMLQRKMEDSKAELIDPTTEQAYQRERLDFLEDVNTIFANAEEDFQSFTTLVNTLKKWKENYEKLYFDAFVPDSLPKLVAPFIKIALADYNPHQMSFTDHDWYTELFHYPVKEEDPKWSKPDPDLHLIPILVSTFVVPVLVTWIELDWDCYSKDQTESLLKEVDVILTHLEDNTKLMSAQAMLLGAVFNRVKQDIDLHCEKVPLVPEYAAGTDQANFCVFRWNQAVELLRVTHMFREMVNPKVVKEQAQRVMESCLLPFHVHLSNWPSTRRSVSGELIQLFATQTESLTPFASDFDLHKKTISAHCHTFLNCAQKQDPETCRLYRSIMEKIFEMRDNLNPSWKSKKR